MKLKDLIKEIMEDELYNPQSDDATFKKGIIVKDINPNCPHHKSMGEVTSVSGKNVTYEVTNLGKLFKPGDELTKSKDQLIQFLFLHQTYPLIYNLILLNFLFLLFQIFLIRS